MRHLTYADKALRVGDETADLVLEYAATLGTAHIADTVTVKAISSDGDDVEATLLLGQGAPVMAETSTTKVTEPDNTAANTYLRAELSGLRLGDLVRPEDQANLLENDAWEWEPD